MSEALYERYKDALRRGHVASLRGRLDAALVAYGEAAELAPERALPHASLGGVLRRLGRDDEALAAFALALERSPRDEASLAGRADILAVRGRRVEAADTLDLLAESLESAGRLPDACDAARRALELAESRERRRHVRSLVDRLRAVHGEEEAVAALERALGVLEPVVGPVAETDAAADAEPAPPDGFRLSVDAEALTDAGDSAGARAAYLAAAAAHRAAGRLDAALDACYLALALAPADPELHLELAEIYLDRGWHAFAADKLVLLARLTDLEADTTTRDRLCALARAHLADDARLSAVCG